MTETPASEFDTTRDPDAVSRFIERFAQVMVEAGMPRIASRIFVALVATDSGSLTAGELAEQLRASPLGPGRGPGSPRAHYTADNDVWYQTITQRDQLLARWATSLREGADVL